jgi:L-serine dehydratase
MGLFGGLLGWDAADERLPLSPTYLREAGVAVDIRYIDCHDPHPNTYRLTLSNAAERHTMIAISTGGGMIEVLDIDGQRVAFDGGARVNIAGRVLHPVLPVMSHPDAVLPFRTCNELLDLDGDARFHLAVGGRLREGGALTANAVHTMMVDIVRILRKSIAEGVAGTEYHDRLLGHQSGRFAEHMSRGALLNAGVLNRTVLYTTALMEVKSSMGVIVAAPTAGACAALPASCIAVAEDMQLTEDDMARAMLAAGLMAFIRDLDLRR